MERTVGTLLEVFNIAPVKLYPRHSVRAALKKFGVTPIKMIEVGTFRGIHAQKMFETLEIEKMYVVDPWEETESYRDNNPGATQSLLSKAEKETDKRLKGKPVIKIKDFSDNAINKIKENVDFIYIDGDHSYKQAKKDMINYWGKLKPGGIMGGHDITNPYDDYGVCRAFYEFCSELNLKPKLSRIDWWVIKDE